MSETILHTSLEDLTSARNKERIYERSDSECRNINKYMNFASEKYAIFR